jgi:integrase
MLGLEPVPSADSVHRPAFVSDCTGQRHYADQEILKRMNFRTLQGHVERWAKQRTDCSTGTFNKELEVRRRILDDGMERGLRVDNSARQIKRRRRTDQKEILIPEREEFARLLAAMRAGGADGSADLAEMLAVCGCRKSEVTGAKCRKKPKPSMLWGDIDWTRRRFRVAKGKNHKPRWVPLFPPFERFLRRLLARLQVDRKEAARLPGYSPATIDRLVERGQLRPNRATGRPRFTIKELTRFADEGSRRV